MGRHRGSFSVACPHFLGLLLVNPEKYNHINFCDFSLFILEWWDRTLVLYNEGKHPPHGCFIYGLRVAHAYVTNAGAHRDLYERYRATSETPGERWYVALSFLVSSLQLADIHVTEDEVIDAILSLKPRKSDASGMSTELLKCVITIVSKPLAALLTASLRHGYIPKCFRDSVVRPIPKSAKNDSVSGNYRLISLASDFSKIIK